MDGFEDFENQNAFGTSTNASNLDFGESAQEDIFAAAGMSMNSQQNMGSNMGRGGAEDDLTPEEHEIMQRVEEELQEKKRQLFEKQNNEDQEKMQRKQSAQQSLEEWK